MIIFEIPSKVISDLYSHKKVYILSLLTLVVTFFLIIFSKSLFWLSVAYTIYGLANALETGTIDVVLINSLKNNETGLQKFLKYQKQISTFSSILGSGIRFLLYFKIDVNIYFISIILILINILLTALFFSDENEKANENINLNF
jgi:putative multidrug-efflux transporter